MSTRTTRRTVLTACIPLFTGCTGIFSDDDDRSEEYEIAIHNALDRPVEASVVLESASGERLFAHTYELGVDKADESRSVDDLPTTVRVRLDTGFETTLQYNEPIDCASPSVILVIWNFEDVEVSSGCPE